LKKLAAMVRPTLSNEAARETYEQALQDRACHNSRGGLLTAPLSRFSLEIGVLLVAQAQDGSQIPISGENAGVSHQRKVQ
jgi:hypothetical protein